jgi:hypothetical protein
MAMQKENYDDDWDVNLSHAHCRTRNKQGTGYQRELQLGDTYTDKFSKRKT